MRYQRIYMHTLDDQPAEFYEGMVVLAGHVVTKFATNLEQIRDEQARSIIRRRKVGGGFNFRYGYHVLHIPIEEQTDGSTLQETADCS